MTAVSGTDIEQVISEARGALTAKVSQLSGVGSWESAVTTQASGVETKGDAPIFSFLFLAQFKSGSFFIQKLKNYFSD